MSGEISSTNNSLQVVNLVNKGTYNYLGAYERASNQGARSSDLTVLGDTNFITVFEYDGGYGAGLKDRGPFAGITIPPGVPIGGTPTAGSWFDPNPTAGGADQNIDGGVDRQFNGYGFSDVRVINGGAFQGNLKLNAILTKDVVGKYLNRVDQAAATADADNVNFNYVLGGGNDSLNLAISAANLAAAGTATREDFVLNISGNGGNDAISTAIINDYDASGNRNVSTHADYDYMVLDKTTANWYANHKLNANLSIDAGAGNDTIRTLGSGDWKVTLGTGNDTYYADNAAAKAVWVFNTTDQATTVINTVRNIDNLASSNNNNYIVVNDGYVGGANGNDLTSEMSGLYGLKLRVVYKDVSVSGHTTPDNVTAPGDVGSGVYFSKAIDVPTTANKFVVTDLNINQAIKAAINGDPVLSKLLVAQDGPANTLVVTALSDGRHIDVEDLEVDFAIPTVVSGADVNAWRDAIKGISATATEWGDTQLQNSRIAAFNTLIGNGYFSTLTTGTSVFNDFGPNPGENYSAWYTSNEVTLAAGNKYQAAFAHDGTALIQGVQSTFVSDNVIIVDSGSSDQDVVVLSTGQNSNDIIKWNGTFNNGFVTVVNFDTDSTTGTETLSDDYLDFTAYGARALLVATRSLRRCRHEFVLNFAFGMNGVAWNDRILQTPRSIR